MAVGVDGVGRGRRPTAVVATVTADAARAVQTGAGVDYDRVLVDGAGAGGASAQNRLQANVVLERENHRQAARHGGVAADPSNLHGDGVGRLLQIRVTARNIVASLSVGTDAAGGTRGIAPED